ncbi:hypothetical protein BCR42DRAFT_423595 [Absidia repens]|uniref:Uncharacterized protein n=1 Tax=Absidia repens TaxID=90262 RepID=A0A1X2I514_9FUNG|nr:hypothetical protein BCR42DRAFT_423595 [Absidia repens]
MTIPSQQTVLLDETLQTVNINRQRLHSQKPSQSQPEQSSLSRQNSEISLYDQKLPPSSLINDSDNAPWTRKQWEALELWYDKLDRDCQRATNAFYKYESTNYESDNPLWSKEYILWRCQCLDTNTKYHCGVLPSERKRRKDLRRRLKKQDLLKRQNNSHSQQQSQGQPNPSTNKGTNSFSSSSSYNDRHITSEI